MNMIETYFSLNTFYLKCELGNNYETVHPEPIKELPGDETSLQLYKAHCERVSA